MGLKFVSAVLIKMGHVIVALRGGTGNENSEICQDIRAGYRNHMKGEQGFRFAPFDAY